MRDASLATQHSRVEVKCCDSLVFQITGERTLPALSKAELLQSWVSEMFCLTPAPSLVLGPMVADTFRRTEEDLSPVKGLEGVRWPLYALELGFTLGFHSSIHLSNSLPIYASAQRILLSIHLSICHSSIHPSIHASVCLTIYTSIDVFIYPSSHSSIHPYVHIPIH